MKRTITGSASPNRSHAAMYDRLLETGEAECDTETMVALNHCKGWKQGEWIQSVVVKEMISQDLVELKGERIIVTAHGKKNSFDEKKLRDNFIRHMSTKTKVQEEKLAEREDFPDPVRRQTTAKKPDVKVAIKEDGKIARLGDDVKFKLSRVGDTRKGVETILCNLWIKLPGGIATAKTLAAELDTVKKVADSMDSARFFIKRAVARGDAEIV